MEVSVIIVLVLLYYSLCGCYRYTRYFMHVMQPLLVGFMSIIILCLPYTVPDHEGQGKHSYVAKTMTLFIVSIEPMGIENMVVNQSLALHVR